MIKVLKVQELSPEAFSSYGMVLDVENKEPTMEEPIFTFWDGLAEMDIKGKTTIALLEVNPREPVFSKLERHVLTEEVFFAMDDVIILVGSPTPGQDLPDPETVRAFKLKGGKGIFLKEGAWHWIPYPLKGKARLLVIFRKGTPQEDLEIKDLKELKGVEFKIEL